MSRKKFSFEHLKQAREYMEQNPEPLQRIEIEAEILSYDVLVNTPNGVYAIPMDIIIKHWEACGDTENLVFTKSYVIAYLMNEIGYTSLLLGRLVSVDESQVIQPVGGANFWNCSENFKLHKR